MRKIGKKTDTEIEVIRVVEPMVTPVLADAGCELADIEFRRESRGWVLRFYIDRPGGVTIDDCALVSRQLSAILEVEDPIDSGYTLEVSSPGLERPLTRDQDFIRFRGSRAKIKLEEPLEGRRVFTGRIEGLDDDKVVLGLDDKEVRLPLEKIVRARLLLQPIAGERNVWKDN